MWTLLAFISALCLGFYDVSKKIALRDNRVIDVLTLSVIFSSLILSVPLILSRLCPELLFATPFFVPKMDLQAHLFTLLKSAIVLSSWVFAFISLKHLPISVVSPMQATRPIWTLIGALLIFDEHLNPWQWAGVLLTIITIFVFSFKGKSSIKNQLSISNKSSIINIQSQITNNKYYISLVLAILIGACSGLYDKYLMRRFDHNAVQVYYTFYQALMMLIAWFIMNRSELRARKCNKSLLLTPSAKRSIFPLSKRSLLPIILISVFLVISDNVYMLALSYPDSMIAVVSTIRRGGTIIGFAYGLLFLKEPDPVRKILCMSGIFLALICLALGAL